MKNKWRLLKIFSTLVIFGFLLSFSLRRFNDAPVREIAVHILTPQAGEKVYFIDEKNVRDFVRKFNPGNKVGTVDIPHLEKAVNDFPSVDSANVYLDLSGRLNVDILQKVPAFRLNKNGQDFYVSREGEEFPTSKTYSHPTMLVTGNVPREDYLALAELVDKINGDDFSRKYFIGITRQGKDYQLLTSEGNYKVELGSLDRIDFKVKGFKTFVEKYLIYQDPEKYNKISVKYDNQIVTTLNPAYEGNDSLLNVNQKDMQKQTANTITGTPLPTQKPKNTATQAAKPKPAARPEKKARAVAPQKTEKKSEKKPAAKTQAPKKPTSAKKG